MKIVFRRNKVICREGSFDTALTPAKHNVVANDQKSPSCIFFNNKINSHHVLSVNRMFFKPKLKELMDTY